MTSNTTTTIKEETTFPKPWQTVWIQQQKARNMAQLMGERTLETGEEQVHVKWTFSGVKQWLFKDYITISDHGDISEQPRKRRPRKVFSPTLEKQPYYSDKQLPLTPSRHEKKAPLSKPSSRRISTEKDTVEEKEKLVVHEKEEAAATTTVTVAEEKNDEAAEKDSLESVSETQTPKRKNKSRKQTIGGNQKQPAPNKTAQAKKKQPSRKETKEKEADKAQETEDDNTAREQQQTKARQSTEIVDTSGGEDDGEEGGSSNQSKSSGLKRQRRRRRSSMGNGKGTPTSTTDQLAAADASGRTSIPNNTFSFDEGEEIINKTAVASIRKEPIRVRDTEEEASKGKRSSNKRKTDTAKNKNASTPAATRARKDGQVSSRRKASRGDGSTPSPPPPAVAVASLPSSSAPSSSSSDSSFSAGSTSVEVVEPQPKRRRHLSSSNRSEKEHHEPLASAPNYAMVPFDGTTRNEPPLSMSLASLAKVKLGTRVEKVSRE